MQGLFAEKCFVLNSMSISKPAKSLGASKWRIIFRHILPNVLHIVIVLTTLQIATAILVEAGVSFLGFGDPNSITWGQQLQGASEAVKEAWWEGVFPGFFITLLGSWLQSSSETD